MQNLLLLCEQILHDQSDVLSKMAHFSIVQICEISALSLSIVKPIE